MWCWWLAAVASAGAVAPAWTLQGDDGASFGASVDGVGDATGDGLGDLVVGAPDEGSGRVFVFAGGTSGPATEPIASWTGSTVGDEAGAVVRGAGSVDGAGTPDVLVATWATDGGPGCAVRLYSSAPGAWPSAPTSEVTFDGCDGWHVGLQLVAAGDLDGDGFDDALVWAGTEPSESSPLYLVRGGTTGLQAPAVWLPSPAPAVFTTGDVDGDGRRDVVTLAPDLAAGEADVAVYLGGVGGPDDQPDAMLRIASTYEDDDGQHWVSPSLLVADLDGDGFGDLIVGNGALGVLDVYGGGATGVADTPGWEIQLAAPSASPILASADVDGDGDGDLLSTGAGDDGSTYGSVEVFLGGPDGPSVAPVAELTPSGPPSTLADAGDVDGDGLDDVLVGSAYADAVDVFRGCPAFDADADGAIAASCGGDDCDDGDASVHVGAEDVPGDGADQDCSGADETDGPEVVDGNGCGGCDGGRAPAAALGPLAVAIGATRRRSDGHST